MRQCEICQKGSRMGGTRILLRGHYNPTNWTRKYPNLQKTLTPDGKRVLACTRCMRTLVKVRAPRTPRTKAPAAPVAAK